MAQRGRGQRGSSHRGRPRGRSQGPRRGVPRRQGYTTSRVQNSEDAQVEDHVSESAAESDQGSLDKHVQSASDDDIASNRPSYATLLQTLNAGQNGAQPPKKRRKLEQRGENDGPDTPIAVSSPGGQSAELVEASEEEVDEGQELDSDDEEFILHDPFEKHYAVMEERQLSQAKAAVTGKDRQLINSNVGSDLRKVELIYNGQEVLSKSLRSENDLALKGRLSNAGSKILKTLNTEELDLMRDLSLYKDIQYGARTVQNIPRLRDIASLHALNHIFKTRDRVLKNNSKTSQSTGDEMLDLRDQGFTRPKVLVIVPTKQACAQFIDSIARISESDQQENKSRFLESYSSTNDDAWQNKPEDFKELFGGNHEEDFRVGLKFTRKTIKYFSGFYNSDVIFGSALGLMRTITTGGGGGKDKRKAHDADFLSSIEVVIVDNASAIQMQNWQHLEYVFTQLNLLPQESHGCDFSRVRHWYLDGDARFLRQTILYTAYHTPEINSLFSTHTHNISGSSKYTPQYAGAMLSLPPSLPSTPSQTFLRFDSPSPHQDADARFTYFTTSILPSLQRSSGKGTLIFIPAYADFTRLRNHFSTSATMTSLSFGSVSEYTPVRDVARARSHFQNARHSLLIYSERAHHHFRYHLRGVRRILFYAVPENPVFWAEVVAMWASNDGDANGGDGVDGGKSRRQQQHGKGAVRALFSRWDVLKLERIVGTARVGRLVAEKGGDTFEFI